MKRSINFYQASLKPQRDPLPLALLCKVVVVTAIVMVLVLAIQNWRLEQTEQQLMASQNKSTTLRRNTDVLNAQLREHRDVSQLEQQLRKQQQRVQYRLALVDYLSSGGASETGNYSDFMTDLARYHNQGIWLTDISVAAPHLQLQGQTLQPSAIATWLTGLKQSQFFNGQEFSVLEFEKHDELRAFRVSTQIQGEKP